MPTATKYASFPVRRITKAAGDDGDLIVWGIATDATLDHDLQRCDPAWSGPAIRAWLDSGRPAVRMAHDSRRPIGKGLSCETDSSGATWVRSLVADPVAVKFLLKQILRDYSIGIADARIRPDPTGQAVNGIICGGNIIELTLCDVGSNPSCGVTIAKSRPGEPAEYVGKAFGGKVKRPKTGKAYRRQLAALDLNSDDPVIREAALAAMGSLAVTKAAAGPARAVEKAVRAQMRAALECADPWQREMARKVLRRG